MSVDAQARTLKHMRESWGNRTFVISHSLKENDKMNMCLSSYMTQSQSRSNSPNEIKI
jgi:hypothetical protein